MELQEYMILKIMFLVHIMRTEQQKHFFHQQEDKHTLILNRVNYCIIKEGGTVCEVYMSCM